MSNPMNLPVYLFWDTTPDQIDWNRHARYVMERVLMYGSLQDWHTIISYYGKGRILKEMRASKGLDPKSLSFLSTVFETPPEEFICFTQIQSSRAHWIY
jgi:hypothetical protein